MHYYKMTIQYAGNGFAGFQWQKGLKTIQGEINTSLERMSFGKITTMSASRTDTGVHAVMQIVKITSDFPLEIAGFTKKINSYLPAQIKCILIENCSGFFKPSVGVQAKEYRYLFTNEVKASSLQNVQFISNISNKLDIEKMKFCIKSLIGLHDFQNFYSKGSNVKSTIREIFICELNQVNPHELFYRSELFTFSPDMTSCLELRIKANGFLKQMIRHIVAALWMVGSGKMSVEQFNNLLNGVKCDKQMWKVAPPNGLFLFDVKYFD